MIRYPIFYRRNMTWRASMFGEVPSLSMLKELPIEGILHVCDNFQMIDPPQMAPRKDNPILGLNDYKKFVLHVVGRKGDPLEDDLVKLDTRGIILPSTGLLQGLAAYKRENQGSVKIVGSMDEMPQRAVIVPLVNYNPLFRARVTGMRKRMRFMTYLLGNIINTLVQAPDRQHFIHIPLTALRFEKKDFMRVFKKMDKTTVLFPEIPQYVFLAHFYALMAKPYEGPSKRVVEEEDASTEALLDGIDPSEAMGEVDPAEFLTNLRSYGIDRIGEYGAAQEAVEIYSEFQSSIFELLPEKYWDKVNFLFTAGDNYVCYNLQNLKQMNGKNNMILLRLISQINRLSEMGAVGAIKEEEPEVVQEEVIAVVQPAEAVEAPVNAPDYKTPLTVVEHKEYAEQDVEELDKEAEKLIESVPDATPAQKERAKRVSKTYKEVRVGGVQVETLLKQEPEERVVENDLPFIKEEIPMPDPTPSSINEMDRAYMSQMFKKDMAGVFASFNKQGMFLTDVQETVVNDEMNTLRTYVAKYEDTRHKTHTIRFTIPEFDENGMCRVNGSLKMMIKQRCSNPICKVSPVRVTLNSNYNKALVVKNESVAHSFLPYMEKLIGKVEDPNLKVELGAISYPLSPPLASDYTVLGSRYRTIQLNKDESFFFDYTTRYDAIPELFRNKLPEMEKEHGTIYGYNAATNTGHFIAVDGTVTSVKLDTDEQIFFGDTINKFVEITGVETGPLTEWVELRLLKKSVPMIFALAYRYGLTAMLKYCNVNYRLEDAGTRTDVEPSDIVIRFKNKRLIFGRTPQINALLFGGLAHYDLSQVLYEDMDEKDVYYDLIASKGLSMNNLKGIDDFFELFLNDPMTRDVLREMRMPTNVRDLLLKATAMLTTREHRKASSRVNFRYRGVEQVVGIVYNEMARAFATYKNKAIGSRSTWSMSDYQIKQRILTEQLMTNVDVLNPIHDIKQYSKFSYSGSGGRSNETFKIADRNFTDDQLGVVSEATVDNAKVGLNGLAPMDPIITNIRGMSADIDPHQLKPSNMLSITSLLMPCVTNDDGKRRMKCAFTQQCVSIKKVNCWKSPKGYSTTA